MPEAVRLVADVGGTNTRIALFDERSQQFRGLQTYVNRDFSRFEDVLKAWLAALGEPAPVSGCVAIAAPLTGDEVAMVNMAWNFSRREVANRFGFQRFSWINDFEGNAYALPFLGQGDQQVLHPGKPDRSGRLAVVGPGTGLGGATVYPHGDGWRATPCEPGHMGLSPGSELELELFRLLLPRFGNIYAELLVSGPGLLRLYEALGELQGTPVDARSPAEISERALAGRDPLCHQALETFCALLGSVCGDYVLANGSYGGLYLAGGIIPRMIPFLQASAFHHRFRDKGAMAEYLEAVPLYAITTPQPGLIGAAHAPL